jgi:hypothetical protein
MKSEFGRERLMSIYWYSLGVFRAFNTMTEDERKESAQAAGDALAVHSEVVYGKKMIVVPLFGECSGMKCTAIIAAYCVTGANTSHLDSEILETARTAHRAYMNLWRDVPSRESGMKPTQVTVEPCSHTQRTGCDGGLITGTSLL